MQGVRVWSLVEGIKVLHAIPRIMQPKIKKRETENSFIFFNSSQICSSKEKKNVIPQKGFLIHLLQLSPR